MQNKLNKQEMEWNEAVASRRTFSGLLEGGG